MLSKLAIPILVSALGAVGISFLNNRVRRSAREVVQTEAVQAQTEVAQPATESVMVRLWEAASAGDADTVRTLLSHLLLLARTPHSQTGSTLLHDIAALRTLDPFLDLALASVMKLLIRHGASVREQVAPANNTPMHALAAQPNHCSIHSRMLCLIEAISEDDDSDSCALELRNAQGLRPQEVAEAAGRPEMHELLHNHRTEWPEQPRRRAQTQGI